MNITIDMKNTLKGINSRLGGIEEKISDPEDRILEAKQKKKKKKKKKQEKLIDLLNNIKHTNICIIWVPEGEGGDRKHIKDIIAENVPNLAKETDSYWKQRESQIKSIERGPYQDILLLK